MSSRDSITRTRTTQVWFLTYPKCLTWASVTVQAAIGGFRESLFLVDFLVLSVVLAHSTMHKLLVLYWVIHLYGNCINLITSVDFDWNRNAVVITPRRQHAGLPLKLPRRSVSMAEVSHFHSVICFGACSVFLSFIVLEASNYHLRNIPLRKNIPTKQKSPSCCHDLKTAVIWEKGKKET